MTGGTNPTAVSSTEVVLLLLKDRGLARQHCLRSTKRRTTSAWMPCLRTKRGRCYMSPLLRVNKVNFGHLLPAVAPTPPQLEEKVLRMNLRRPPLTVSILLWVFGATANGFRGPVQFRAKEPPRWSRPDPDRAQTAESRRVDVGQVASGLAP